MKNRHTFICASGLAMLVMLITQPIGYGQKDSGSGAPIQGHVADERGGAVAGAEVRLSSRIGFQLVTKTDLNGDYSFENVKTGSYILEVNASGFAALTSEEIQLEGNPVTRDFRLPVAS